MKLLAKLSLFIFFSNPLVHAQDDSVNQKLDLILKKLGGLETRVSSLEQSNQSVKSEIQQVEKKIAEPKGTEKIILPAKPEEKSSFLSNLRRQLKSDLQSPPSKRVDSSSLKFPGLSLWVSL